MTEPTLTDILGKLKETSGLGPVETRAWFLAVVEALEEQDLILSVAEANTSGAVQAAIWKRRAITAKLAAAIK